MPRENTNVCSICGNPHDHLKRGENGQCYCPDCISREHLILCAHQGCNKYLKPDEVVLSGQGYLCKTHWDRIYTFCSHCGIIIKKDYTYNLGDGKRICQNCFDETYFQCSDCGKVHKHDQKEEVCIDGSTRIVCKKCKSKNYIKCSHCQKLVRKNDMFQIHIHNSEGSMTDINTCHHCAEELAHQCNHCGEWYEKSIQFHEEGYCNKCYYRRGIIHSYHYKPQIKPQKAQDESTELLFGVENEIELKYNIDCSSRYRDCDCFDWSIHTNSGDYTVDYKRYIAYKIDTAIPGFFYQKNDGSIHFGMEVVSHPATLEFWRSQREKIEELFKFLRDEGCQGDTANSVGMHIHVTRNKMNRMHQNTFAAFVYFHRKNIENLAGRKSNSYTKMLPIPSALPESEDDKKSLERRLLDNHDRYSAVNWNNKHTVELRMFQSTLNTDHFLANIEFSHALYFFSKEHSVVECVNDTSWKLFCDFVKEKEYTFLKNMMVEKDIFTE